MYVYVTLSHDYADEFNVDCCFVDTKERFEENMAAIKAKFQSGEIGEDDEFYFGTNEFLRFDSFGDFENGVTAVDCSEGFYNEFRKLNNDQSVGYCVMDSLLERDYDDDDDDDGEEDSIFV